jgi:3-hydroxyisobutyrate dehydrogenase-like beta-hydroxyacid dehydrogenase
MTNLSRLAFIGLGIMGKPMAGHLLKAGHGLAVHSRTKSKAEDLLSAGATWAKSPAAAAADADVVFICVTDTPDVESVLFGGGGVIESARPGLIVVDHSTISPSATKNFAARLADQGTSMLDAPVSGGDTGARNATLSIMVGGDQTAFQKVLPLLNLMGKTITHCGASGSGQLTKLVNQILVSVTNLAVCEALTLAVAGGLDRQGFCPGIHDRSAAQGSAVGSGGRRRRESQTDHHAARDRDVRRSAKARSRPGWNSGIVRHRAIDIAWTKGNSKSNEHRDIRNRRARTGILERSRAGGAFASGPRCLHGHG